LRIIDSGLYAPFQSRVVEVGQDEHSLALVGRSNFRRAEYSPRCFVTKASQFLNDCSESERDVSFDVLKEAKSGPHESNSICDEWPEVSGIFGAESLPGCAEWLAGVSAREDVHLSRKL
jgi:hypothetical protein